jgi:hypothetical protein
MPLILSPTQIAFNARGDGKFNKPFQEQLAFFQQKLNLPTEHYDDILKSAHDRAFIVAGATKADLLTDLRNAVDKSIAEGKSIQWFRKEFAGIVQRHGWAGWTGSDTQAGRDWRTRVIYRTNLSASYAAGRWQQLNDPNLLKSRPYWKYVHNDTVAHPRPLHQSWSGLVLKHDDPWWQTHFPPNGWGCRCRVMAVGAHEYEGAKAPDEGVYVKVDRYGDRHVIPKGIDYGWDYAPGRTWTPQVEKYPYELARQVVADYAQDGVLENWHGRLTDQLAAWRKMPEYSTLQNDDLVRALRKDGLIPHEQVTAGIISPTVKALLETEAQGVFLSADTVVKQLIKRDGQAINAGTYLALQEILDNAQVIKAEGMNKVAYWRRDDKIWFAVIKTTRGRHENYLVSIRHARINEVAKTLTADELALLGLSKV